MSMKVTDTNTQLYNYDRLYRLIFVDYNNGSKTNYYYDSLGNRTNVTNGQNITYTSNALNQYEKINDFNCLYDKNGNLTSDGIFNYAYDCENRLTSVEYVVGYRTLMHADYYYDYRGRRVQKHVSCEDIPDKTINYCYDGDQIIAEYNEVGALQRRYVYGPGIDEPLYMTDSSGVNHNYFFDGLGSVVALAKTNQTPEETYTYDVFGNPTVRDANGAILAEPYGLVPATVTGNLFMFTGREYDKETGLYYYRARYYSPQLGRFLQTDPIGYKGGLNIYAYCLNNPLDWVDPYGLVWARGMEIGVGAMVLGFLGIIDAAATAITEPESDALAVTEALEGVETMAAGLALTIASSTIDDPYKPPKPPGSPKPGSGGGKGDSCSRR